MNIFCCFNIMLPTISHVYSKLVPSPQLLRYKRTHCRRGFSVQNAFFSLVLKFFRAVYVSKHQARYKINYKNWVLCLKEYYRLDPYNDNHQIWHQKQILGKTWGNKVFITSHVTFLISIRNIKDYSEASFVRTSNL